ncbi:hypothetical protein BDV12DRAFT_108330 [Aspergillus spectabilis]
MPRKYTELYHLCPRSFLFAVIANIGPGGASRSLAVAYRQGDNYIKETLFERVGHFVADTLALIDILSDPANRAPLEAERALAEDWYRRSQGSNEVHPNQRSSVPDSVQPPWLPWNKIREYSQQRPQLPWRDDTLTEFPFTATCLLLGLLGDHGEGNAKATKRSRTRPGDVQLQPLSTVFRGDCLEYGLVVLDISDLDSGVKYGIAAFPVRYMAEVQCRLGGHWDPVEDPPPEKEPDIVPFSPRPRELLSNFQWLSKYYRYNDRNPNFLRLDNMPLVGPAALDYIWPREINHIPRIHQINLFQPEAKGRARASLRDAISNNIKTFWSTVLDDPPTDLCMDREKDSSTTRASSVTISGEPPQNTPVNIDSAIDDLLVLTQEPAEPSHEKTVFDNLQMLAKFPEKLQQRLEEVPDSLGPSKISSHVLRVAYAGRSHLNWVAFQNLPPSVIAAAVASDELRGASALSLCVDKFKLQREGDLKELAAAVSQCTGLRQLCLFQPPGRDSDDASAHICSQLLLLWERRALEGIGGLEWLRGKSIYPTCAFSTSLRSREFLTLSSTITHSSTYPHDRVFPVVHMFRFVDQGPDVAADNVQQYQNYYALGNTLLDAESFAVRFLAYLRSLGSGLDPEKSILRFAHNGSSSSSPPGHSSVSPIPAGFCDYELRPNDPSRVRLRDIQPGSWVVLVDSSAQIWNHEMAAKDLSQNLPIPLLPPLSKPPLPPWDLSYLNTPTDLSLPTQAFLHYSFINIRHTANIAHKKQQQIPLPIASPSEVVGGLRDFLCETIPGTDISTWEQQAKEVERDIYTKQASIGTGNRSIDIGVMAESRARALLNQLL